MSIHEKALNGIFDDMDDLETKKMFPGMENGNSKGGFSVTITMNPDESHEQEKSVEGADSDIGFEDLPADHDSSMCKGGCMMHKGGTVSKPQGEADIFSGYDKGKDPHYKKDEMGMAQGGMVPEMGEQDNLALPPFLRKKKIPSNR